MRRIVSISMLVVLALGACEPGEHREARDKYNDGIDLLVKPDFDAAEKALLDARSSAGLDPELRFRAAYDLGMSYAAHADKMKTGKDADLAKALELEQQAVSWFSDASRLHKEDKDTQANLAIVRARAQALSDELRRGEGKLEARLDAVIKDQRGVLEEGRSAWAAIKQTGGADPLAQQSALTLLADKERGIVAEAGVIGDLAADEIDSIGKKAEDKRTDEEKVRVVQLKNLDLYLLEGRARIAESRRKLQELAAEQGVDRAEAALVALKRAREQLLDPITVLREVAGEELQLMQETLAVGQVQSKKVLEAKQPDQIIPAWLQPPVMAERQGGLRDRVEEVRARLAAAVENSNKQPDKKPEQQKLFERLQVALPLIGDASAAQDRARKALTDTKLTEASDAEREALIALSKAIEQFADLKQTIDLAWETQQRLVGLLSPEAAKQLPAGERASETKDALARNLARMPRIKELLADEVAKLAAQEQQIEAKAGAGSGSAAPDPKQVEAAKQQVAAMKQQIMQAETLRGEADKALAELAAALKANHDPLTPAKAAQTKIEELRRLFFNLIEHLQELIRQQGETKDQTSQANTEDDFTRAPKLPGLVTRQDEHLTMAKAITEALAKQADAASKQQGQPQPGQPDAKAFSAAAAEVRLAENEMTDAKTPLTKASSAPQSVSLKPSVDSQAKAIEHLENALKLLQPPQKQDQDKQKQDQQQQQQQQQQQKDKEKQDQQQQQQGGAGQRARDEDARRQREKREHESQSDPVEKDW
ncbi:MAG: hypothetical protein JWO36_6007 [Myxococcales bacterium]|nr:hypothetical protein [Myxococcales bacterium]